jgi:hypothetical protein
MRYWTRAQLTKQKQAANDMTAFLLEFIRMIVMVAVVFRCNKNNMPRIDYASRNLTVIDHVDTCTA